MESRRIQEDFQNRCGARRTAVRWSLRLQIDLYAVTEGHSMGKFASDYFILRGDEIKGPTTADRLRGFAANGKLLPGCRGRRTRKASRTLGRPRSRRSMGLAEKEIASGRHATACTYGE